MRGVGVKITQIIKVIKPTYCIFKLTPDTSIRNYNSEVVARAIASLYKPIYQQIKRIEKTIQIEQQSKVSFLIDISLGGTNFYLIVPIEYKNLFKEKIISTWNKITIDEVESIPQFSDIALKYYLAYKYEDPLSLNLDRKCNEPLNSILNVIDILQENDRVGVFYNFMPMSQSIWRRKYDRTLERVKKKECLDREVLSPAFIIKEVVLAILEVLKGLSEGLDIIFKTKKEQKSGLLELAMTQLIYKDSKEISKATNSKREAVILNTQLVLLSDSENERRKINNVNSVRQAYDSLSEDNVLISKKLKGKVDFMSYKISGADTNKMSTQECQNLLEVPGRELLQRFSKMIKKVDTLETQVPEVLQSGVMSLGINTYKGNNIKAYLSNDKHFRNLTLCLIGPTRAGKTTLIANLANDGIKCEETTILFDFCGNCELSKDVSAVINKDKVLDIDCSNFETLQGLGYNEVIPADNSTFQLYRAAKTKTSQLMTLVNSINDNEDFRSRMERVLESAAVVVFIQNGSIKQVFDMLQDHKLRHTFINSIPNEQRENLDEYVNTLLEIDEWSKGTKENPAEVIGTKVSYTQGILSRVQKLKQNSYMELMLKKDCSNNINLVDEMQKAQLICIKMPEIMFSTEQEKDIYCTYWLTKIWGALQYRKWSIQEEEKRVKTNIVIDELYQVPNCQEFLRSKLSQIAKFTAKPIISCHYLGQIGQIRNELKAANSSYMLLSGCDKDNFKELKEELAPYELEDLINLKRYHSLNLIKYEGGWAKFITKMPAPVK